MFTKLLTCGQAFWFGVQCLTRTTQGLSISLLEINTAVHAICTLALYLLFWWNKPLDVEEPTILTHADTHPFIAHLLISQLYPEAIFSEMDLEDDESLDLAPGSGDVVHHLNLQHILLRPSKDPQFLRSDYLVYHGFAIPTSESRLGPGVHDLTELAFERFNLASIAAKKYRLHGDLMEIRRSFSPTRDFLEGRLENQSLWWYSDEDIKASELGFLLAGLFYGGIHLLVWN